MKIYSGNMISEGKKYGIIVARFNEFLTSKLMDGAIDTLKRHGVKDEEIEISWVPGAFELPLIAKKMSETKKYDGIICLGAVIRGQTPHFEFVSNEAAKGIAQVSLEAGIPISFGVLTTDTLEQAIERAGTKAGNKGVEAANSTIEMVNLIEGIK